MNPASGPDLRDIHLPPPPGWWPPAPGWWLVALAVLALMVLLFFYAYRMWKRRRRRKAILAELDRCIAAGGDDPAGLATALSQFLRRLSKQTHPAAVALSGSAWLEHLDRRTGSDEFTAGVGRVLVEAPYRPAPQYDMAALKTLVRRLTRQVVERERVDA